MSIENPRVAIVGLGFGAEFIPIYQRHPNAEIVAICQRNEDSLNKIADEYGIAKRFTDYEKLLEDPEIDAVHINTPIPHHAEATLQGMRNRVAEKSEMMKTTVRHNSNGESRCETCSVCLSCGRQILPGARQEDLEEFYSSYVAPEAPATDISAGSSATTSSASSAPTAPPFTRLALGAHAAALQGMRWVRGQYEHRSEGRHHGDAKS